jgi:dienelactone hydrolase
VLTGNAGGTWEVYGWAPGSAPRPLTSRPNGTTYAAIPPAGQDVWWFADTDGDEFGVWRRQPWDAEVGADREAVPGVPPAYPAGLVFGPGDRAVIGGSDDDGTALRCWDGTELRVLYRHAEDASVEAITRDGTLVAISHSEHGDSRHPALRVLAWDGTAVAELDDGPGLGLHPITFLGESDELLVGHERRGRDELLVFSPRSGAVRELDLPLDGELSAVAAPDGSWLAVVAEHRGRSTVHRYVLATGELTALPTGPGTVDGIRIRPDGITWYDWSSAASAPTVRDLAGGEVLPPAGEPSAPPSVAVRDVIADGPGGPVPAFLRVPERGDAPYPTVFSIHGGPTWHDSDEYSPRAAAWVDAGYAVVTVNYRGSTGYGAAWRDAIEASPGHVELADIAAVRSRLVDDGVADPARCILEGGSWGGFLTLLGLGIQPQLWACGSAAVPVADYVAAYEDEMEGLKAFDRSLFGGSPTDVPEVYAKASPLTYVDAVRAPVLILAGANDPRCPIRQIENYLAALAARGAPHEVYRFDAGHGSYVTAERIAQMEAELDFVQRHAPA